MILDLLIQLFNDAVKKETAPRLTGLEVNAQNGTTTTEGFSRVIIGNNIATGTDKNSTGILRLFSESGYHTDLSSTSTGNRNIGLPNANGILALVHAGSSLQELFISSDNNWTNQFKFGMSNTGLDLIAISNDGVTESRITCDSGTKRINVTTPNGSFYVQGQ